MNHHAQIVRTNDVPGYQYVTSGSTVIEVTIDRFGIDDARAISAQAQLRPATSAGQVFVIKTSFVNHEAQNALLKLFEEPPADTQFVLVLPPAFQLLPTLQSRIGIENADTTGSVDDSVWQAFIVATHAERLKQIELWQKSKDPAWLMAMTQGVHAIDTKEMSRAALLVVQLVGAKLQTRGASNKMLLEHLALAIPLRK